jgi:hypothetical protein
MAAQMQQSCMDAGLKRVMFVKGRVQAVKVLSGHCPIRYRDQYDQRLLLTTQWLRPPRKEEYK